MVLGGGRALCRVHRQPSTYTCIPSIISYLKPSELILFFNVFKEKMDHYFLQDVWSVPNGFLFWLYGIVQRSVRAYVR